MNNASWLGTGSEQDIINIKNTLAGDNGVYISLMNSLSGFQTNFLNQLVDKWACQDAVNFGGIFADTVNTLINNVNAMFVNFFNAIDEGGRLWATNLQTSYVPINFSPASLRIDASMFRENINGIRGIDKDQAVSVISNLSTIRTNVSEALSRGRNVIVANPNFFGQSTNYLIQIMSNIENEINSAVEEIVVATQNAINATIEHYENTAGRIAQAFTSQI